MSRDVQTMIDAAKKEWEVWGKSVWNVPAKTSSIGHRDNASEFAEYVIKKYCSVAGGAPTLEDIQDDRYAWSAVGLSAILKFAGFTKPEFPFAQSHSIYIRKFIKARIDKDKNAAFWGFEFGEPGGQPDVGDLVAYARGKKMSAARAKALFKTANAYESHADLVVARRKNEIDVIGANVMDSVTMKTLSLDDNGHIADPSHFWFATLKYQN